MIFMQSGRKNKVYTAFRTISNPQAIDLLSEFRGLSRNAFGTLPRGYCDRDLKYDLSLANVYLAMLERAMERRFKYSSSATPLRDPEADFFPQMHVVDGKFEREIFVPLIESLDLSQAGSLDKKLIRGRRDLTEEMQVLQRYGIQPLILDDRVWVFHHLDFRLAVYSVIPQVMRGRKTSQYPLLS